MGRKMAHHEFHASAFKKYHPILARSALDLVRRLTMATDKESDVRVRGHVKQ